MVVVGEGGAMTYTAWNEVLTWLFGKWRILRLCAEVSPLTKFTLTGEVGARLLTSPVILTGVP